MQSNQRVAHAKTREGCKPSCAIRRSCGIGLCSGDGDGDDDDDDDDDDEEEEEEDGVDDIEDEEVHDYDVKDDDVEEDEDEDDAVEEEKGEDDNAKDEVRTRCRLNVEKEIMMLRRMIKRVLNSASYSQVKGGAWPSLPC